MVKNVSLDEKICESFYADKLDSLLEYLHKIKTMGEWRFDLSTLSLQDIPLVQARSSKPLIFTCRKANLDERYRYKAYKQAITSGFKYIDLDIHKDASLLNALTSLLPTYHCKLILSYHNFQKTPTTLELERIFKQSTKINPNIFKVATMVHSDDDINKLLELQSKSKRNICFGMGEMATTSRVKSLIQGAAFTYIALNPTQNTAPGQVDFHQLFAEYEKQAQTKQIRLAVIGKPISQSKSPTLFQEFFEKDQINGIYEKLELEAIHDFTSIKAIYQGFNITAPFKQEIISMLDVLSPAAKKIGAVNTIHMKNGKWYGDNTDYIGIISAIKMESAIDIKKIKQCLILGAGGAARAAIFAMKKTDIEVSIINRTQKKAIELAKEFAVTAMNKKPMNLNDFQLIINTTPAPLDMIDALKLNKSHIILDAVYPVSTFETLLKPNNCFQLIRGERWLKAQAEASYRLFLS